MEDIVHRKDLTEIIDEPTMEREYEKVVQKEEPVEEIVE